MFIESFSHPKLRDFSKPSDDTILLSPGIAGVFDGATDARGRMINNLSPGRLASETVAKQCAKLFSDYANRDLPALELMRHLSVSLEKASKASTSGGKPTTTLALALYDDEVFRFIINGDSGIRVNGTDVFQQCKEIDTVSATARVLLYHMRAVQYENTDEHEIDTRKLIFLGFKECLANGLVTRSQAEQVVSETQRKCVDLAPASEIEEFLMGGIQNQYLFGNCIDKALGFSTLNGSDPLMRDVLDVTIPIQEVHSVEVFSDGYFQLPEEATVHSWENSFRTSEEADYHKIKAFPNVKGSTSREFSDDRSVIAMLTSQQPGCS